MKVVTRRNFTRKVRGLTSKVHEIRSNPSTTDTYPITVTQLYKDRMDKYYKDFERIYGFIRPPREVDPP